MDVPRGEVLQMGPAWTRGWGAERNPAGLGRAGMALAHPEPLAELPGSKPIPVLLPAPSHSAESGITELSLLKSPFERDGVSYIRWQ